MDTIFEVDEGNGFSLSVKDEWDDWEMLDITVNGVSTFYMGRGEAVAMVAAVLEWIADHDND